MRWCAVIAVCAAAVGCGESEIERVSANRGLRPVVPLDKFVQLRANMPISQVHKLLGTGGEHQFTYLAPDGHIYVLKYFEVSPGSEFRYPFDLLVMDGKLFAILDVHDEFKALPKDSPFFSPHSFDDDAGIPEFLGIESFQGEEIAESMPDIKERVLKDEREWKEAMRRDNNPNSVLPHLIASGAADADRIKREYDINTQHSKKFDAQKIEIGMTESEVNQVFGAPRFSEVLNNGYRVAIYGPSEFRAVNPDVATSPVMVLFRDGAVIRVLSHRFFEDGWRDKIWPAKAR